MPFRASLSVWLVLAVLLTAGGIFPDPVTADDDPASSRSIGPSGAALDPAVGELPAAPRPALALGSAPLSTLPCTALWSGDFPRADTGLTACSEYSSDTVGGVVYRVFYPAEWDTDPTGGWGGAYLEAAREAVTHSAEVYGAFGTMASVTLVFSVNPSGRQHADEALYELNRVTTTSHEGCAVFAYPDLIPASVDQFRQLIAHEMFHCFQDVNLMDPGGAFDASALWWLDGSADYFSNVAYPNVNLEWKSVKAFDEHSPYARLTQMQYAACFFFQYLGNTIGNTAIIAFLATLPASGTEADQQAALRAYGGMDDRFQDFAQQYLDKKLLDTSGVPIPFNPTFATVMSLTASGTTEIKLDPLVIHRAEVAFDPAMTFTYEVAPASGASRHAFRPEEGSWGPAPGSVDCDDPHVYRAAFTSVGDGISSQAVITATTTATTADCTSNPTDRCLVGDWHIRDYAAFLEAALGMAGATEGPAPITLDDVSGDLWFTFDEDTLTYTANDFALSGSTVVQGMAVSVTVRLEGQAQASYDVLDPGTINLIEPDTTGFSAEAEMWLAGSSMGVTPIPAEEWIFFVSPTYGYTCSESQLDLTIPPLTVPVVFDKDV